jgi:uncharacterized protein (TIGR02996 family)
MNQDEAFLCAILENPHDDGVRLIYADWLDEHGQAERAEFIRLQIAGTQELHQRALLSRHAASWFRGVRSVGEPVDLGFFGESTVPEMEWQVRRGFVEGVRLSLDDFQQQARTLFAHQPVTRVTLTDRVPQSIAIQNSSRSWFTCLGDLHLARFSYDLPCCLEPFLGEPVYSGVDPWKRWDYPSLEAAQAALSHACVGWGRQEAGLPPLLSAVYNPGVSTLLEE